MASDDFERVTGRNPMTVVDWIWKPQIAIRSSSVLSLPLSDTRGTPCERIGANARRYSGMDLDVLLTQAEPGVLDEAYAALQRSQVTHYEEAGEQFTRQRLADLFALVLDAIRTRNLAGISEYCEEIAVERYDQGFGISEVQTAFNALEEAMWRRVISAEATSDLPEAIGLLSTVLGFGKDALARKYVSLASQRHVPSLDLSALFAGTTA